MADFVLNLFEFDSKFYKQISGSRTKFAPRYACIFIDHIEAELDLDLDLDLLSMSNKMRQAN